MKLFSRVLSHDLNKQDNEVSYYEALITHNIVMSHLCGDVPNLVHPHRAHANNLEQKANSINCV